MKRKIDQEVVFELAERLVSDGIEPTTLKIRELNENHGSLTSITPLLKQWKEARLKGCGGDIPDMPEAKLLQLLRPIWGELVRESQSLFMDEKEALNSERSDLLGLAQAASAEVDRQENVIEKLNADNAGLAEKLIQLTDGNHEKERALAGLQERIAAREQQIGEYKKYLSDARKAAEAEEQQHAAAVVGFRNELENKVARLDATKKQLDNVTDQLKTNERLVDDLTEKLTGGNETIERLNRLLTDNQVNSLKENSALAAELAVMKTKLGNVEANFEAVSARADALQSEVVALAKLRK
ncbi:MAG: DNA-binding protein [Ferrimonas sp.]